MTEQSRYRLENGEPCVDIKITAREQLFDNRDPAPFRERDLHPELSQYLLDAGEDLLGYRNFRVVFWLDKPDPPVEAEIELAFQAHFEAVIARMRRSRIRRRRTGQLALLIAVILVIVLLALAQFVAQIAPNSLGAGLKEGLVISSWVVMWRPVEILIYDWIPTRHERRIATKLLAAAIDVRAGKGPAAPDRAGVARPR